MSKRKYEERWGFIVVVRRPDFSVVRRHSLRRAWEHDILQWFVVQRRLKFYSLFLASPARRSDAFVAALIATSYTSEDRPLRWKSTFTPYTPRSFVGRFNGLGTRFRCETDPESEQVHGGRRLTAADVETVTLPSCLRWPISSFDSCLEREGAVGRTTGVRRYLSTPILVLCSSIVKSGQRYPKSVLVVAPITREVTPPPPAWS